MLKFLFVLIIAFVVFYILSEVLCFVVYKVVTKHWESVLKRRDLFRKHGIEIEL